MPQNPSEALLRRRPRPLRTLAVVALSVGLTSVVAAGPATATAAGSGRASSGTLQTSSALSALPSLPLHVTATLIGPGRVKVTWAAPTSAGSTPIVGYAVGYSTGESGGGQGVPSTARTAEFTDLETGTYAYTFSVWASNAAGDGPRVTVPLTVVAVPPMTPTQTVSRSTVRTGDRLTVSGRGNPGARLTIDRALPGQPFTPIGTVTADSTGHYADTITALHTATYRTRGATGLLSTANQVVAQNRMTFGAVRQGFRTYTIGGRILPAAKGQQVKIYNKTFSGSYSLLARVYTDQYGRWSYTHAYLFTRTYTFKAVSVATSLNTSATAVLSVSVR